MNICEGIFWLVQQLLLCSNSYMLQRDTVRDQLYMWAIFEESKFNHRTLWMQRISMLKSNELNFKIAPKKSETRSATRNMNRAENIIFERVPKEACFGHIQGGPSKCISCWFAIHDCAWAETVTCVEKAMKLYLEKSSRFWLDILHISGY